MDKRYLYKTSIGDIVLAGLILSLSLGLLFSFAMGSPARKKRAFLYKESTLVRTIRLSEAQTAPVRIKYEKIVLEVEPGRIRVVDADCPRKICINTGWITMPGQMIVCVPNRILIEIAGMEDLPFHAVSY